MEPPLVAPSLSPSGNLPMSSTMLHSYSDEEDDSVASFHTARASSFHSTANTINDFLDEKGKQEEEVTMRRSVSGCSNILFNSGFINHFTSYAEREASLHLQHYLRGRMLRQIHRSANGETYLAELTNNGARTLYAIKVIRKDHCRKLMERNVLKSLSHTFLPIVYANAESIETAFLVMDFCPGGDLRALLRRNPLKEETAKFYATEVLLAMEYLHAHGVIYRGLTPENVLIKANGHIMLSGFDYAMWRVGIGDSLESEEEGGVALAPEVAKGKQHGPAADWYAFGIFLYELLFGTTPFKARDGRMKCINVLGKQRLKFPRVPMVSPAARDLIVRLLSRNPKRRLGHNGGAAEVKQHAFFHGINFALVQKMASGCMKPPELPL